MTSQSYKAKSLEWFIAEPLADRVAALRSDTGVSGTLHTTRQNAPEPERAKRWRAQFPFADGDLFAQRLAAAGITQDEFMRVVDEPIQLRPSTPATWFRTLAEIYSRSEPLKFRLADVPHSSADALFPFLRSTEPLLDHYVTCLMDGTNEVSREHHPVPFDARAVHKMFVAGLLQTFKRILAPTLILELSVARLQNDLVGENSSDRFQSFISQLGDRAYVMRIFEEYPVLARQLVRRADLWLTNSLQFLRHLSEDWPMIREVFAPDIDPGTLVGLQAHLGDSHGRGKSVLIASFSSGVRIVYKPRSLAVDLHFQEFVEWLNQRTGDLIFRTLRVLNRSTYGWMEFVDSESCASTEGIRRFYERQGGFLALVYLLHGSDFHCENVIASGEHPILVDLEALFHGRIARSLSATHGIAAECWETSVLRTGLLPIPIRFGEGMEPLDRSGLSADQAQMTPFGVLQPERTGTDEMHLVRKHASIRPSGHWPTREGQPVAQLDGDAIVRGFRRVYEVLLTHQHELLDQRGPVARFQNDEVRIVLRHTLTYARLLAESFHPDVLRNALDRDQMFDLLWGQVPDSPHLSRVITAECADLWNGDVPLFTGRVGSRDIFASTGERVPDFLPEPNDEPVRRRIKDLSETDLERQVWLIRASLMTLSSSRISMTRYLPGVFQNRRTESERGRLIAEARSIGDRLEVLAVRSQTQAGWIGLRHDGKDQWTVRPLGPDLYEGTAGIVLFLAYLAAITKEERYQNLALAGAATLRHQVLGARGFEQGIGAFSGWGGLIYVYSHLAVLWNRVEFIDDARSIVEDLFSLVNTDQVHDVIGGAAGCIGSLLAMHEVAPSDHLISVAMRCADNLVESAHRTEYGRAWLSRLYNVPLGGFSHGASGIAWALLALSRITGETRFRQTAMAALEFERSLFDAEKGSWADLRPPDGKRLATDLPMTAWCHGAAGIGLSRLGMLADESSEMVLWEIEQAVKITLTTGFGDNHSLCHGDLGNLDFILQASGTLNDDTLRAEVGSITGRILHDLENNGWKCGIEKRIETPGLMVGLAGIGYGMLRLAEPRLIPSVITLSPPIG